MKTLRIIFTILSAISVAVAIPVAVFADFTGLLICGFLALLFYWLMTICKQKQEQIEQSTQKTTQNNTAEEEKTE